MRSLSCREFSELAYLVSHGSGLHHSILPSEYGSALHVARADEVLLQHSLSRVHSCRGGTCTRKSVTADKTPPKAAVAGARLKLGTRQEQ